MRMRTWSFLIPTAAVFLSGCALLSSSDSREYEAVGPEGEKRYLVSYNPHGLEPIVDQRRKSAMNKVRERCGNDYEIVSEEEKEAGRDSGRTVDSVGTETLMYIEFRCTDETSDTPEKTGADASAGES